jgi:hypothetical protein
MKNYTYIKIQDESLQGRRSIKKRSQRKKIIVWNKVLSRNTNIQVLELVEFAG